MGKENRNPAKKPSQETNDLLAQLVELATETNRLLGQLLDPYTNDDIGQADDDGAGGDGKAKADAKATGKKN